MNGIKIHTAFSRDQTEKVYVQNIVLENSKEVYEKIKNGAYIYVFGNAKIMPDDVYETFQNVMIKNGGLNKESAKEYMKYLEKQGRYQTETY